jgi:hypothetical protein
VGIVAGEQLQKAVQPKMPPNMPNGAGMQKAQDKFQGELNDLQSKYKVELIVSVAFRFLAAALLVAGSIKALGKKEGGRKLLMAACAVALIFELGHAILQTIINTEMMTAVNSYMENIVQSMPQKQQTKELGKFVQSFASMMVYLSVAGIYILMAIKGGVYLFGLLYLRKLHVKELFA